MLSVCPVSFLCLAILAAKEIFCRRHTISPCAHQGSVCADTGRPATPDHTPRITGAPKIMCVSPASLLKARYIAIRKALSVSLRSLFYHVQMFTVALFLLIRRRCFRLYHPGYSQSGVYQKIKIRETAPITIKIMIAAMIMAIVYPMDFSCGHFIRTGNPT